MRATFLHSIGTLSGAKRCRHAHQRRRCGSGEWNPPLGRISPNTRCYAAIVRPVPVQDQGTLVPSCNDVAIGQKRRLAWQPKRDFAGFHEWATSRRARKAILKGKDRIAGTPAGEVGHKKTDLRFPNSSVLIIEKQEVLRAKDLEQVLRDMKIAPPPIPQFMGKRGEGLTGRKDLLAATRLQENNP